MTLDFLIADGHDGSVWDHEEHSPGRGRERGALLLFDDGKQQRTTASG